MPLVRRVAPCHQERTTKVPRQTAGSVGFSKIKRLSKPLTAKRPSTTFGVRACAASSRVRFLVRSVRILGEDVAHVASPGATVAFEQLFGARFAAGDDLLQRLDEAGLGAAHRVVRGARL